MGGARPDQLDSAELVRAACLALAVGEPGETVSALKLVVVDDLQEATRSTVNLIAALARRGIAIVAFGDPDVATNAFRGGEPDVLGRLGVGARPRGHHPEPRHRLSARPRPARLHPRHHRPDRHRRHGRPPRRRAAPATVRAEAVLRLTASTPAREAAAVARRLREHHLLGDIAWRQMAVIVRSGAQVPAVARALALAEVPTRTSSGGTALRDHRAARSLLRVVDVGIGRTPLTPELAGDLLLGPFGGLDRLALRRLRLALRAEELAGDGRRSSDELLVDALSAPGRLVSIDSRVARNADHLAATLGEVRALAASGGTIEELLWLVWKRSGLADAWRAQALGTGILAAEANSNLDGVLALFTAATRFVERQPDSGPSVFLEAVLDAEVPEDTLSPRSGGDSVLVTTPSGAIGLEFEVVALLGVQDGIWPNLKSRGSLLYPQRVRPRR